MTGKGQYLPVETVLSFGLGLMIAVATIAGFNTFREEIMDTAEEPQVEIVEQRVSEVLYTFYFMDEKDIVEKTVVLPEKIAGKSYDISMASGELRIAVGDTFYSRSYEYLNQTHEFQGTASGGSVNIMKRGNQVIVRDR